MVRNIETRRYAEIAAFVPSLQTLPTSCYLRQQPMIDQVLYVLRRSRSLVDDHFETIALLA